MNDRELYQKKLQAQLDEWKADVDKLKAKASGASADGQLAMNKHIATLESKLEEGKTKLSELVEAGDTAWESVKDHVESTWNSLKSAFTEDPSKSKDELV